MNSLRTRIRRLVDSDPTTIRDAEVFLAKWGEYPIGHRAPSQIVELRKIDLKRKRQDGAFLKKQERKAKSCVITHPDREMIAANEYFHGTATWRFEVGIWTCIRADECLKFLLKKPQGEAQLELTRRGFRHEWKL